MMIYQDTMTNNNSSMKCFQKGQSNRIELLVPPQYLENHRVSNLLQEQIININISKTKTWNLSLIKRTT